MCLQPLRVNGVKVYTENVDKRQVIMDLQIRYVCYFTFPTNRQHQSFQHRRMIFQMHQFHFKVMQWE